MIEDGLNNKLIKMVSNATPKVRPIKKILVEGANINHQTSKGETALMHATINQHTRIVEYLLKQGANPLLQNINNKIASELVPSCSYTYTILKNYELLFATRNNDLTRIKTLINSKGIIDFQEPNGYTALMIAVEQNQKDIISYLLSQGACLLLTRADGQGVFNLATDSETTSLLQNSLDLDNWITETPNFQFSRTNHRPNFFQLHHMIHEE